MGTGKTVTALLTLPPAPPPHAERGNRSRDDQVLPFLPPTPSLLLPLALRFLYTVPRKALVDPFSSNSSPYPSLELSHLSVLDLNKLFQSKMKGINTESQNRTNT